MVLISYEPEIACVSINPRGALACGHKETSMLAFKSKKNGNNSNVNQCRNVKINYSIFIKRTN